jgi:aspartate/methionine/tyrosine aminotransferase
LFAKFLRDAERMSIRPFQLERYFARYEFQTPLALSSSDCEALSLEELLSLASEQDRARWAPLKLGYTESAGHPELREWIAAEYEAIGADQVITAVPEEAIYLTMRTLLQAGDRIVCTFPGYQSLYEIGRSIGCEVNYWQPREGASGWDFSLDDLEPLLELGPKAVIVNFPHNPTGAQLREEDWHRLLSRTERDGIWLVSDEMYRGLEYNGSPLKAAVTAHSRGISIAGLSKAYGLAGLRSGWVVSQSVELLHAIQSYKDYTTICGSGPGEYLSLLAMKQAELLRTRCRKIIRKNREKLEQFMTLHTDYFEMREPHAGPICFPKWRGKSSSEFCEKVAAEAGIMMLPSTVYDAGDAHLRIGFGRENFAVALDALAAYLKQADWR